MPNTTDNQPIVAWRISVVSGFITNSSSCIHWFDRRVLKDKEVATFLKKYELVDHVGRDIWCRSSCASFVTTPAGYQQLREGFKGDSDYCSRDLAANDDRVIVVYGDEYGTIFSELANLLKQASQRLKLPTESTDFN